ncbi:MAG: sporulation protein YqfD [Pygmaiobacter sp.]
MHFAGKQHLDDQLLQFVCTACTTAWQRITQKWNHRGNPEFASISLNFIKGRLLVEATSNLKKPTVLDNTTPMDIVSAKRGIIEHIEIYSGYAVCKVGQLVEPGTLLVSHQYTDPLTNTSVSEYAHAKIQAKTVTIYCCEQPYEFAEQVPTGESVSYSALCVGKKELPLYRAQTLPSTYEKTEILRPLAPMGWCLPAALKTETIVTTTQKKIILSAKAAETRARYRCYQQINADYAAATIETVEEKSVTNEDALVYTIIVTAVEQIEKLQQPLEIN